MSVGSNAATPRTTQVEAFISPENLRKIASDAFKHGKDAVTLTIARDEKTAKVTVRFEAGLIRFAGAALSKFVKNNLED